jgi:hypothetical protein
VTFADWNNFTLEFTSAFCPENKVITATGIWAVLPRQVQHRDRGLYWQFKDLINMSGYTDPITIVLKFCRGLNVMTQDKITKLGTDRPQDNDHDSWYKATCQLNLNCPIRHSTMPCDVLQPHQWLPHPPYLYQHVPCSLSLVLLLHQPWPLHLCKPLQGNTFHLCTQAALEILITQKCWHHYHSAVTDVAKLVTSVKTVTNVITSVRATLLT